MPDETLAPEGAPDTSTPVDWDGSDWSPETLGKQTWWGGIPETARGHITKAHEERMTAKERSDYLDRLFSSDDDTLRKDFETTKAERDALKKERDDLSESLKGIETRQAQEKEDAEYTRLETAYPDIWKDIHLDDKGELLPKGAYVKFVKLLQAGETEEDAAVMARAVMVNKPPAAVEPAAPAGPPKTRDVKPPPSIAQASKGGANPSATVNAKEANEGIDQRRRRLQKQYEAEEGRT
jgi:hypothetical protein